MAEDSKVLKFQLKDALWEVPDIVFLVGSPLKVLLDTALLVVITEFYFKHAVIHFVLPYVGSLAKGESNSVVIMDCRIHDSGRVLEMVRERGGIVIFLPWVH